jgi:2OG-Fe(II) oxygenase superfamily/Coenzyme PQQ synthesis protein D (PqqD)
MHSYSSLRPRAGVLWRDLGGRLIVLDGTTGRYFQMEGSAARIWRLIHALGRLDLVIPALAADHDGPADGVERDVRSFIDSALSNDLLEDTLGPAPRAESPAESQPALQIRPSGLTITGSLDALRERFERDHYVRLPQLVEPALMEAVERSVAAGQFVDRSHHGIGTEQCLVPGVATSILQLMFNDPAMLDAVADIARCGTVRCFDGRVYRMAADNGHYDSWHSDAGEDRRVAISVNLSREPYEGGELEIRDAAATEASHTVSNPGFGDAVMFRISPALRHRVGPITGPRARTAYAGWFRASPDFQDLFFASLPAHP